MYLPEGVIPPYAPSKTHISQDAQWELQGVQEYVAALAAHDLANTGNIFVVAAYDLGTSSIVELSQGHADRICFFVIGSTAFTCADFREARILGESCG